MKTHNKTFRRLLVALLTIIGNAYGISAHPLSFNYTETDETADSAGVFNEGILYPVVSNQVPTSLTSMEYIKDEESVLNDHLALTAAISLDSPSEVAPESMNGEGFSVGQIPITSNVSPSGGRIYSIPISIASGWAAAPQVSLCYNSQAGNGIAGYGWNISGLSSIEIRNRNYYYDGDIRHSEYDSSEAAYSLDGMPIVASEGDIEGYGYATPTGNLQIKKHLTSSGILSYFTVLYPDGSKATFGFTDNDDYMTSYPITKLEDINGNTITFNYNFLNNNFYISNITYGQDACISFQYESRTDAGPEKYRAGVVERYPYQRITSIISKDGDDEICRYGLTYEYKDDISLLRQINCVSDGASYKPLSFTYGIDSIYDSDGSFQLTNQAFLNKYFPQSEGVKIIYKRGKFIPEGNNDGIIMYPYRSEYDVNQPILCNPSTVWSTNQLELTAGEAFLTIEAADVNGDGTDELVKVNKILNNAYNATHFNVSIYSFDRYGNVSATGFTFKINDGSDYSTGCSCYFGDFRGDGRTMLVVTTHNSSKFALIDLDSKTKLSETGLFTINSENERFILAADFENDGQDDICRITDNGMDVYKLTPMIGTRFIKRNTYTGINKINLDYDFELNPNQGGGQASAKLYVVDINGDGYNDIAAAPELHTPMSDIPIPSSTWNMSLFNGKRFVNHHFTLYARLEDDEIMFMDVDKDGYPDMLHLHDSTLVVVSNVKGMFQKKYVHANLSVGENAGLIPCDISVFGRHGDIMVAAGPNVRFYEFDINHSTNRLLTQLSDSHGLLHNNVYRDISKDEGAYLTDNDRSYDCESGFVRMRIPLPVLYGANTVSDGGIVANEYYTYYDAVFNNQGLGFCGFGKTRVIDYVGGYSTVAESDPEKMGIQTRATRSINSSNASPFEETVYWYDDNSTVYGKLNPRLIKSETTDFLSGVTTVSEMTYDDYDFPTSTIVTKILDEVETHVEKSDVKYEHNHSEDRYVLGVVKESSVTKTSADTLSGDPWREKSILTHDEYYRPLTRKEYVIDYGLVPVPAPDSSFVAITTYGRLPVNPPITLADTARLVSETRWEYDTRGNVISEVSAPYGITTFTGNSYAYDSLGRFLVASTDPLGHTTTYSGHNKFGKPTVMTDYLGRETSFTYDEWGNLTKTEYPDGSIEETALSWGGQGLYTITVTASGAPTSIVHYDRLGREIRQGTQRFDGQWQWVDKFYDSKGQLLKESLPFKGEVAQYWNEIGYDAYGRKISLTEPSGKVSTWVYDGISITSCQNGIESTRTYDANGNLTSVSDAGGTITYTLRNDGQPSKVTAPDGVVTRFSYDGYGRRIKIDDPSAGEQTDKVVYNNDGSSVSTHTNPNGTIITYSDRLGRTTKIERPGEYNTEYIYDSRGLLVQETSTNGTSVTYTYDNFDRVSTEKEIIPDGSWLQKTYTYLSGNNVSSIEYLSSNGYITTEHFTYQNGTCTRIDASGLPVRIINFENEFGQPTSVTTGGITRTYSYNAYGMPTRRTMGTVMDYSYSFDPLKGNLMSRTDNLRNQTETFGYDALNRLTAIGDREITYSDNGNITSIDSVGDMTYDNSAKPYQVTSLTLEEDIVPSRVQNVTYTCYSRPSIMEEGGRSAAFTYNADGARVKMNVSDGATSVLSRYYIGNQYELDVTPTGTTERLYLGGDAYSAPAVYIKEGSGAWTFYNIGRDYLGNITHIATADGTLVEENSYDPWGRLRNPETKEIYSLGAEPELMLGRGYTGHEHLTWFGLINMNARLYDPVLGRFLSPDPFVQMPDFTQNFNRYSYCLNNPLVYVDENGESFTAILVGAAIGIAIDYLMQVGMNYMASFKDKSMTPKDIWLNNIDWFDAAISGVLGGISGGVSSAQKANELSKFGIFFIENQQLIAVGETLVTSAVDITSDGFQQVEFQDFAQRAAVSLVLMGVNNAIAQSKSLKRTPNSSNNIDALLNDMPDLKLENQSGDYSLYFGIDPVTNEIKYVGITGREPQIRFNEHLKSLSPRADLDFQPIIQGLSYQNARIYEQYFINTIGLENLYNKINSISPYLWPNYNL